MKIILFVLAFMIAACNVRAQSREWSHPCVGYSNTSVMTIDRVEFLKNATVVHAAVDANGDEFGISTEAYLSANGKALSYKKSQRGEAWQASEIRIRHETAFLLVF